MIGILRCAVIMALGFGVFPGPADAQRAVQDRAAMQAVGLFQHSCMPFAGLATGLRGWIASHHLIAVPAQAAAPFLGGEPGQAFWASTPDGKMMLVSNDSGACRVVMPAADKANVDQALQDYFASIGSPAATLEDKVSPDGKAHQTLWMVSFNKRSWLISTTTHADEANPAAKPLLIILATDHQRGGPRP